MEQKKTLTTTLYVGIGGTGANILLQIKKCFIDSYGEIPPMIGFLAIDTDNGSESKTTRSNTGTLIKLDASESLICSIQNALSTYYVGLSEFSWLPKRNVKNLALLTGLGAGQVRSNGRFLALYNRTKIENAIKNKIAEINAILPLDSKYSTLISKSFNATVNVFSSVAGGTGSGMLIDVLGLINKSTSENSLNCRVFPYLLLPDIFKTINQGPAMANVYYNAYGILRELDYIMNLKDSEEIDLGYHKVGHSLFEYAFVFNNFNLNNASFTKVEDIEEVIAKCAFLPANEMGASINSPFDNVMNARLGGAFLIPPSTSKSNLQQKDGWTGSAGSAELLYDGEAVARAQSYSLISSLCRTMCNATNDGTDNANNFVDDPEVLIRENLGHDDVIDKLCTPAPTFQLTIDETTDVNSVNTYLQGQYGPNADKIKEIPNKYAALLKNSIIHFDKKIADIMSATVDGAVGDAIEFISALKKIIGLCMGEMKSEAADFNKNNATDKQWATLVNGLKTKNIFKKYDHDAAEILQNEINNDVINHLEEERRNWAIRFYTKFEEYIDSTLKKLQQLKVNLTSIDNDCKDKLVLQQHLANNSTLFTIYLHTDDVNNASKIKLTEQIKTQFIQNFAGQIPDWTDMSQTVIDKRIWDFVTKLDDIQKTLHTNIETVLNAMPQEKVSAYLNRLKEISAALWNYDLDGTASTDVPLSHFFIVGVCDRDNNIFKHNENLAKIFDSQTDKANFATTYRYDRISVLSVNALLPVFAVKGYKAYSLDNDNRITNSKDVVNYIDNNWFNRMEKEKYSPKPTPINSDGDCLKYWVFGIIFGLIKFDNGKYCTKSITYGDPVDDYIVELGTGRIEAFNKFKELNLSDDIESRLEDLAKDNGISYLQNKIEQIKKDLSYKAISQLSPVESENLKDPHYEDVRKMLGKEIDFVTKFTLDGPFIHSN